MALPIIIQKAQEELSKIQKRFNQKIKKIDMLKAQIALIDEHEIILRKKITDSFDPILKKCNQVRIAFIEKLDQYFHDKRFNKTEKEKLSAVISQYASIVLETEQNEKAIEIYNRHTKGKSFEQKQADAEQIRKEMIKREAERIGFNFSDEDFEDPEAFMATAWEQAGKIMAEAEKNQSTRKKKAKQLEREQKEAEQAKILAKTTKALYTDLAKILHPDLEHDDAKKQEKTELMHKVTAAYEKNDIFTLLNLHIRYAQDGENKLDTIAEEQIKFYILHLNEQIKELEDIIYTKRFFNFSPMMKFAGLKTFQQQLTTEEKRLREELKSLKNLLIEVDDVSLVKYRLKHTKLEDFEDFEMDMDLIFEMMSQMDNIFQEPKNTRKKK